MHLKKYKTNLAIKEQKDEKLSNIQSLYNGSNSNQNFQINSHQVNIYFLSCNFLQSQYKVVCFRNLQDAEIYWDYFIFLWHEAWVNVDHEKGKTDFGNQHKRQNRLRINQVQVTYLDKSTKVSNELVSKRETWPKWKEMTIRRN